MPNPAPIDHWQLGRLHETDHLKQISNLLEHPDVLFLNWQSDFTKHTATAELVKGQFSLQIVSKPKAFHVYLIPHTYNDTTDQPNTILTHPSTYIVGKDPDLNKILMLELHNMTDHVELTLQAIHHLGIICKQAQCYDPFDL